VTALAAGLEVKGERYPVTWACRQKLNEDTTLTLRPSKAVRSRKDWTGFFPQRIPGTAAVGRRPGCAILKLER